MMKLYYPLLVFALVIFVSGCDKDDPKPADNSVEIVKEEITETLAAQSDLTEFVAAFEDLELEAEDVAQGITIFAPINSTGNPGGRTEGNSRTVELTPEALKGHMIKGLIDAGNLNHEDTLISLNNKLLIVSVEGDEVRVNGILLTSKDLASTTKYVIHKVEETLPHPVTTEEPASIVITVWNSLKWSLANPKGLPEEGATVSFYASREDYPNGTPVYTAYTDVEGKAVFSDAEAGKSYFILAKKHDLSNIFYPSLQPGDNVYSGFVPAGIFQTQEEIETHATQPDAAIGNFRWQDLTADLKIDESDKAPTPSPEVKPVFSETQVEVFIGYGDNSQMTIRSAEAAMNKLQEARTQLNHFHKNLVMTDGILSDDAEDYTDATWGPINNFTFDAGHSIFTYIWNTGYNTLGQLNMLVRDVPQLSFAQKEDVIAEAKGMRAYVYLQLTTYFGDVPIMEGITLEREAVRNTQLEVFNLIEEDLQAAVNVLPPGPSNPRDILTTEAAKVLLARLALYDNNYTTAASLTEEVLQSSGHTLAPTPDQAFTDVSNPAIIWDFTYTLPTGFPEYFSPRTFCPALRFAEVYLINAEANIKLGNFAASRERLDIMRERLALPPCSGTTTTRLMLELQDTWDIEMDREGSRFANMVRWGIATDVLNANGYDPNANTLLPIPQPILDQHPNITQNIGYH